MDDFGLPPASIAPIAVLQVVFEHLGQLYHPYIDVR